MAQQDDFVRLSLRLPTELHERLTKDAAGKRSLNAEIIGRLEASYDYESKTAASFEEVDETLTEHEKRLERLERWVLDLRERTGEDPYNDDD